MRVVTSAQMAELDRRAVEQHGLTVATLMAAAGRRVAQVALDLLAGRLGPVVVLAGKGHNGGDGLVAARELRARGIPVRAVLSAPEAEYQGQARRMLEEARAAGVEAYDAAARDIAALLRQAGLVIDALFGTGFRGPVRGAAAALIEAANASGVPILAVDVPSGLDADTGRIDGPCIRAAATVTMGLPKVGLLVYPGAEAAGTVYVADIGYPAALADDPTIRTHLVTAAMVREALPPRPPDSHKGTYGRTLVVAGSVGYTGAAVLAALGALRAGAGLVGLAVAEPIYPIIAAHVLEAMPSPLPSDGRTLSADSARALAAHVEISDAVACGPGLSTAAGVRAVVESLLASGRALVLDADGLNVLAGSAQVIRQAAAPVVITPHPGELARLLGSTPAAIAQDRLEAARSTARDLRCIVLLKGAATVVATPEGDAFINPTGNPGMASGGMGDVLTGAIASLIGQGVPPAAAAWSAAYLHGLAADLIAEERGVAGMLASEVAHGLPGAIAGVLAASAPERIRVVSD